MFAELVRRLGMLFRRNRFDADLDEEMRLHRELRAQGEIQRGISPQDAHYAAQRYFGNDLVLREESRDMWGWNWLEDFSQDVRLGLRMLVKNPGFTTVAVVTLALGIGANTAVFSVVNAVVLKPLGFSHPDRIVTLASVWTRSGKPGPVSAPDFDDWHNQSTSFAAMAFYQGRDAAVVLKQTGEYGSVAAVSPEFFQVFSIHPMVGREFSRAEEMPGSGGAAIVSSSFAQRHFGSNAAALGQTIRLFDHSLSIVGVLPPGFHFPQQTEIWWPADTIQPVVRSRGGHNYRAVALLKPDVPLEQAQTEMRGIAARLAHQYPATDRDFGIEVTRLRDEMVSNIRMTLYLLLAAVGLVLVIACANLATLLLARGAMRSRETVLRAALGASRGRILRQLVTESLLLALLAGGVGAALAILGAQALVAVAPSDVPHLTETAIDVRVLAFTLVVSLLSSLLSGLAPALYGSRSDLNEALKQGGARVTGGGARWLRSALVVVEISLSVVLLAGAGLLLKSFVALHNVALGFAPGHVLVMKTSFPAAISRPPDADDSDFQGQQPVTEFYRGLLADISNLPGVVAAGATMDVPGHARSEGSYRIDLLSPHFDSDTPHAVFSVVTPGAFATLRIPVIAGRDFDDRDTINAPPTAIINQSLAREAFSGRDPLGHTIVDGFDSPKPMRIVGVVGDVRQFGPAQQPHPEIYMPYDQHTRGAGASLEVLVRATVPAITLDETLRREVKKQSSEVPVRFSTLDESVTESVAAPRFRTLLVTLFAGIAMCLAIAGVYGVLAYVVSQRWGEIGVRMALGATKWDVLGLVFRQGLTLAGLGVTIGLLGSFAATRLLSGMLFDVKPDDPVTYLSAVAVLAAAAAASFIPALRATKVDPLVALRYE